MSDDGFVRVGSLAEIPEGESRAFDVPWGRVAVTHVEHRIFAFGDECPHAGCSLAEGSFDDRTAIVTCARDDSAFDVETGEPVGGPALDPVPVFRVREVDGWVEVSRERLA